MIKNVILAIAGALFALVIYLFVYLGVYKSASIGLETRGPLHLLYKTHIGAYYKIDPTIDAVEALAREKKLSYSSTYGEYLDNPQAVDQDRLRANGGCVLDQPLTTPPPEGFHYEDRPAREYVVGTFTGSPAIGPYKVYGKAKSFAAEHGLKLEESTIEIYVVNGSAVTTTYLFPVLK